MASSGSITFTRADVRVLAGERTFERGLGYLGSVTELATSGARVTASVSGTEDYRVVLTMIDADGVRGECDCPQGKEGFFCKHCVAVALTVLDDPARSSHGRQRAQRAEGQRPQRAEEHTAPGGERDGKPVGLVARLRAHRDDLPDLALDQPGGGRGVATLPSCAPPPPLRTLTRFARSATADATEFAPYGYVREGDPSCRRRLR